MVEQRSGEITTYTTTILLDWERARLRAALTRLSSLLTRRPNHLASWSDAKCRHGISFEGTRYDRLQPVRVAAITGSVDRHLEFDRYFNPLRPESRTRWVHLNGMVHSGASLPPVQLYKLGDVYYVRDGHLRVSVARFDGIEFIEAEVTEFFVGNT